MLPFALGLWEDERQWLFLWCPFLPSLRILCKVGMAVRWSFCQTLSHPREGPASLISGSVSNGFCRHNSFGVLQRIVNRNGIPLIIGIDCDPQMLLISARRNQANSQPFLADFPTPVLTANEQSAVQFSINRVAEAENTNIAGCSKRFLMYT